MSHRSSRSFFVLLAAACIGLAAIGVHARNTTAWLTADDFQLIGQGQEYDPGRAFAVSGRTHFYRPIVETWFAGAVRVCGRSVSCYHALNIGGHVIVSLLVAALAGLVARRLDVAALAGLAFAVEPAPVEAIVWVSAMTEVLATMWFVATVMTFLRWRQTRRPGWLAAALAACVLCLLSHESGVTVVIMLWLAQGLLDTPGRGGARERWLDVWALVPFGAVTAAYLLVAWIVNSQNYLVAESAYAVGPHIGANLVSALGSLAVGSRSWVGTFFLVVGWGVLVTFGSARLRFFACWVLVTLLPVLPFEQGLASRYLYLPAVGFAGVVAELLGRARDGSARWARGGQIAWMVLAVLVMGRFASFASRNALDADQSGPFRAYAVAIRAQYPDPPRGAHLLVNAPPEAVAPIFVQPLLRWEFDDPTLTAEIVAR